ncbi:MAG: glycosyl hydrolase family 18 protein [Flavobacteriales bacterium]
MKKQLTLIAILLCLSFPGLFAQKVIGFFPNWRNAGDENKLQYDKITDIIFCFVQPNSSGQFPALSSWSVSDQTKFNNIKIKAAQNGVRVRISSGGAGSASLYSPIAANATYRQNFATSIADFIVANNIDGFDVDWEFPATNEKGNMDLLLSAFRTAFDAKQQAGYRHIYLGVDVGGEQAHTAYFTNTFAQYVDEVNIMAYDLAGGFSTVALAKTSFDVWKTYLGSGAASKLILGVPFYDASGWNMYSGLASPYSTNAANAYNGTLTGSDGSTYNAAPAIKSKVDYTMQNGGGGIMIWELSQDILDATYYQYSLLSAIDVALQPYQGPSCSKPSLGSDKTLCGVQGSITLNSNLSTQSYRTFTWTKDGGSSIGSGATLSVSAAGTYVVKVDSAGACNATDTIIVSATLPTVNLGNDINLCSASSATLNAGVSGSGITYQWAKDGSNINGASNQTLVISQAGTYSVTVSASGCSAKNDQIIVSSSLLNITHDTICTAGATGTLTVNSVGGPYKWYSASTNGTLLHTGATYATTYNSNTTVYVQDGAGVSGTVGGTGNFGSAQWHDPQNFTPMTFTTAVNGLTLTSVDFYIPAWAKANNFVISVKNGGTTVGSSSPITYDNAASSDHKVTVSLNITLSNAGSYTIGFSSSTTDGSNAVNKGTVTYPISDGSSSISFTAGDFVFNNIQFVAGSTCVRTPATVTIDANNAECLQTGVEDFTPSKTTVYPNPFTSSFTISNNSFSSVEIYNLLGESVLNGKTSTVDASHLQAGTYLVKVLSADGKQDAVLVTKE